ncbi:MAG: hypothetical protein WD358_00010 [Nitriliruptoraceae bacterium]
MTGRTSTAAGALTVDLAMEPKAAGPLAAEVRAWEQQALAVLA